MEDTKVLIKKIISFGVPIAALARRVDKDTSTLSKWIRGESKISPKLEKQLLFMIEEMNKEWQDIINGGESNGKIY